MNPPWLSLPSGLPTPTGVAQSLALLRKDLPFADVQIYDRLDLLLLPFLEHEPDLFKRAGGFRAGLRLAAAELAADEHDVAACVLLHSVKESITARRNDAANRIAARRDGALPSARQVEGIEARMLNELARTLIDAEFAARYRQSQGISWTPTARDLPDSPVGYVTTECEMELRMGPADPRRHEYVNRLVIEATRHYAWLYFLRTEWTGGGVPRVRVLKPQHGETVLGSRPEGDAGSRRAYFFHLGEELIPGVPRTMSYAIKAVDSKGTVKPRLDYRSLSPAMRRLRLAVRFPRAVLPSGVEARRYEYIAGEPKLLEAPLILQPSPDGLYSHEWPSPQQHVLHAIEWDRLY